jgi:hypothetical protein
MNLVDTIKNQLFSDGYLDQLSSLIGAGESATKSAIGAAVPTVLSAISNLASSGSGSQKVVSALSKFDAGSLSNTAHMLSGQASSVLEQGSSLLNSLLGGNLLSGIVSAVSKFSGIGGGAVQKLLGYLMPMILGGIAGRFAGKAVSAQGLTSMLADQKASIANALPSGFSINDIPGLASVGAAARGAVNATGAAARGAVDATATAGSSLLKWALPVAAVAAIALVAWYFLRPGQSPVLNVGAPDVSKLTTDLTGDFKSLTSSLTGITDAASASAALPKLTELSGKLDDIKAAIGKLPAADKTKITDLIKPNLAKLEEQFAKLQWIPGVGDKVQPAVDGIMGKLASLGGLPTPQFSQLNGELAGVVTSLTESLTGIKDAASAEKALPKLADISSKLDSAKATMDKLPEDGRATISKVLMPALTKLKELAGKVIALAGVGDKLKPVLDGITSKLTALVG